MYLTRIASLLLVNLIFLPTPAVADDAAEREQSCLKLIDALETRTNPEATNKAFQDRREEFEQWATEHPDVPIIQYAAGLSCVFCEDVSASLPYLKQAYEKSDHNPSIGNMYALSLKMAKKPLESIEVIREVVSENAEIPQLKIMLAIALIQVQEFEEALEILTSFASSKIDIDEIPKQARGDAAVLRRSIGECYLYLGEHEQAIATLEEANELLPNAVTILTRLGEAQLKHDQLDAAKKHLLASLERNENYQGTLFWLGVIAEKQGEPSAKDHFERAYASSSKGEIDESDDGAHVFLHYQICEKLGKTEEAERAKQLAADLHFTYEAPWNERPEAADDIRDAVNAAVEANE